jgi:hypothetical protein
MKISIKTSLYSFALAASALTLSACGGWWSSRQQQPAPTTPAVVPAAVPMSSEGGAVESTIRFLEDRVKSDPDDFIALNKLSGYYQQRAQETGDVKYLELSEKAARASLKVIPAENNPGALASLAQTIHNLHDFAGARDQAMQLIGIETR